MDVVHKLKMKKLLLILFLLQNISFAQTNEKFFNDFLLEDQLSHSNELDKFKDYDFSGIWTKTKNDLVYGIIGTEHQRIRIKLISIHQNPDKPEEYLVTGKSNVKETICDFKGVIRITEIKEVKELHYGVDNEYENREIKTQGIITAQYEFEENRKQIHSGIFTGELYSKWYLDSKNQMRYDNIQSISDSYTNNAFIGIWKSYETGKEKICNWADYRVPLANRDFDIGAGEFSVSQKYWNKGWLDIALTNKVPNEAVKTSKSSSKRKEWWE